MGRSIGWSNDGDTGLFVHLAVCCVLVLVGCKKTNDQPNKVIVDPSDLRAGPVRHEPLSSELVARITRLQEAFQEVDPTPLSKWIDDFKRDEHPESELETYETMERAYTAFCRGRNLSLDAKREVYGVVIQRSAAPDDEVLKDPKVKAITLDDVKSIVKLYDAAPKPIRVVPSP